MVITFKIIDAQDRLRVESPQLIYQSFFTTLGSESGGYGTVDVVGTDSLIFPYSNPALISTRHLSGAVEIAKNENSRDPFPFKFDNRWLVPSYGVIQFPFKAWKMAVGYANHYDLQLKTDLEEIITIQQPAGTGEFWDARINIQLHSFFSALQYNFHPKFSMGLNFGINYLRRRDEAFNITAKADAWSWQTVLGVAYKPDENLILAASYRYLSDIEYELEISGDNLLVTEPDTGITGVNEMPASRLQSEVTGEAQFPWEIKVGMSYCFLAKFHLFGMINFQHWSRVDSEFEDQQQLHVGLQGRLFSTTRLSVGFFTQWEADQRDLSSWKYLSSKFITLGLSQKLFQKIKFNISYLDSRLFTHPDIERDFDGDVDSFHQIKVILGVQYTLF